MRRLRSVLLACLLAAVPLAAAGQPAAQPDLSANNFSADQGDGTLTGVGDARLRDRDLLLEADTVSWRRSDDVIHASGHVVLTQKDERMLADDIVYHRRDGTFTARNVRAGRYPFYVVGTSAKGTLRHLFVEDATVIYREPGPWQPTIHAKEIEYSPGHFLRVHTSHAGIGDVRPLPLVHFGEDLSKPSAISYVSLDGGYRSSLGAYADAALHLPVAPGFSVGPDVGIYTARGVMAGPVANYNLGSGADLLTGDLHSGFIEDGGNRMTDILGNPVPRGRGFVDWNTQGAWGDGLTLNGTLNWWTDSEVYRDFRETQFNRIQEPDNFLEVDKAGSDSVFSVFTRFQPDPYFPVQQRLPEIQYDLLPSELPGGVYQRFEGGLAELNEIPPEAGQGPTDLRSTRLDAFYGLSRPIAVTDWLEATPVVGTRFTDYWSTEGADSPGGGSRLLGEVGFDATARSSASFDYTDDYLGIDGLRHLMTPVLSYRYIPDADKDSSFIPPIDRTTFSTDLPELELGDMRSIDQLQAENVLRIGVNNTLQTRDHEYGSRDLARFDLAEDFRFERAPGETAPSDLHADFHLMPARWIDFGTEGSVSTSDGSARELTTGLTIHDADLWSVGIGTSYLTDSYGYFEIPGLGPEPVTGLDNYHLETRVRLNDVYEAFTRFDYDARARIFDDQAYGVYQKIANTWIVQYTVTLYSGNTRAGHFGFNAGVEMVRF